jgi:nitroreductase
MNETMNTILTRRSVRSFLPKQIPEDVLAEILQAGLYAPSGQGKQTWHFSVVTNQEQIKGLAQVIASHLGRDSYNLYAPAALIIPSNLRDSRHGMEDNACALENIFLAAWSYGVGSCWINQCRIFCDEPDVREILHSMQVPDEHVVYGMAALGYPAADTAHSVKKTGTFHYVV